MNRLLAAIAVITLQGCAFVYANFETCQPSAIDALLGSQEPRK